MNVSFVIPALNEEKNIAKILPSIHQALKNIEKIQYEIIVADNGSTDKTKERAQKMGARVIDVPKVTIGHARNVGAEHAINDILVFLDADITLGDSWGEEFISNTLPLLKRTHNVVTGAQYKVPPKASWVEVHWFKPVEYEDPNGINGGHLIITKSFFKELNGFNASLESGEDSDICIRARKKGTVFNNPHLNAIHHGFPTTLLDFFKRQRWYGRGGLFQSKKIFATIIVHILIFLVFLGTRNIYTAMLYSSYMVLLAMFISYSRCKQVDLHKMVLATTYIIARTVAVPDVMFKLERLKGTRVRQ